VLVHVELHGYMTQQFYITQSLGLSFFCGCINCFIVSVFCFCQKYGRLLEKRINVKFLVKMEKNDTDIYKLFWNVF
jgi:hypothetical protein